MKGTNLRDYQEMMQQKESEVRRWGDYNMVELPRFSVWNLVECCSCLYQHLSVLTQNIDKD